MYLIDYQLLTKWFPDFLGAFVTTLKISIISGVLTLLLGSIVALLLTLNNYFMNFVLKLYISVFRNFPLLVQLYFFFYGLPFLGIRISPFMTGVLAITLNEGAFVAEIVRGSINGIPKNDWEAGTSLGLTKGQILRMIIFPQALRNGIPALTGQISFVVKDTSLFSIIMIVELTKVAHVIYNHYLDLSGFFFAAIVYIAIFIVINNLSFILENKYRIRR